MQGRVSLILYLSLSFNYMTKREDLTIFFIKDFLHLIKYLILPKNGSCVMRGVV